MSRDPSLCPAAAVLADMTSAEIAANVSCVADAGRTGGAEVALVTTRTARNAVYAGVAVLRLIRISASRKPSRSGLMMISGSSYKGCSIVRIHLRPSAACIY